MTRGPFVRRAVGLGLLVSLALATSCGGRSRSVDGGDAGEGAEGAAPSVGGAFTGGTGGSTGGASAAGFGGTGGTGGTGTGGSSGASPTGGSAGEPPFTEPGCPDAAAPPGRTECNVFETTSGCGPGEGCYPTIGHPFGMGCDQQTHGSRCAPAGIGVQGDTCPGGTLDCAAGFICIVGSELGSRCMRMCPTANPEGVCPLGLFCGETDALGVGVCA